MAQDAPPRRTATTPTRRSCRGRWKPCDGRRVGGFHGVPPMDGWYMFMENAWFIVENCEKSWNIMEHYDGKSWIIMDISWWVSQFLMKNAEDLQERMMKLRQQQKVCKPVPGMMGYHCLVRRSGCMYLYT